MEKEKKGIWTLIELLNEYSKNIWYFNEEDLQWQTKAWILSKEFWFIKWLVENDKIDTSKANDKNLNGYEIELRIRAVKELVADSEEKTVLYLNLLMLLAIQDEPIRFLCEIIK